MKFPLTPSLSPAFADLPTPAEAGASRRRERLRAGRPAGRGEGEGASYKSDFPPSSLPVGRGSESEGEYLTEYGVE